LADEADCPQGRLGEQVEHLLQNALAIARAQGALAWELRSATTLAQLWQRQSRHREALELLTPIHQRFTEGYATPDLRKVSLLLDALHEQLHTCS
jgi:predicted ATPase